ncbi:MAG: ATP-binding protein, partial [Bacteroidota bacterium]
MKSPFKFLDAYTRKDRDVFFGRETEIEILYDLVSQNRLVLVYGQSGAGKTSLIQCGLSNRFKPTNWFPIFIRRGNNLNDSIRHELEEALGYKSEASLPEIIEELYEEYLRPIYLILDQLEEVFILGDEEERELFIRDIAD